MIYKASSRSTLPAMVGDMMGTQKQSQPVPRHSEINENLAKPIIKKLGNA